MMKYQQQQHQQHTDTARLKRLSAKISTCRRRIRSTLLSIRSAEYNCFGYGEEWEDKRPTLYDMRMLHEREDLLYAKLRRQERRLARYEQLRCRIIQEGAL